MKIRNSFSVVVDSPKLRQSLQFFYGFSIVFFFIGSLAELFVAIFINPSISWTGFLPLMIGASLLFLTLSAITFSYSRRYLVLDKDKVRMFTGFKKKELVITKEHVIKLEIRGTNAYNVQRLILLYKGNELVCKYAISFAESDPNATERVANQINAFAQINQCSVQSLWKDNPR